ncbi:MAG: nucleotidyltransferase domain-containing protein [candidate division KSB1 bacterium]|nr:nucleotidyltransferase domain-containing protein [candidate division KSB1 bacterium]MDZ7301143.1 nucleotidyltransferase domain-containing protein [candidate division KSB1 bacterium]MDZ7311973.1 nucleotidyltransferase domain-containing protein [candidate division KSB1 bacterium]
MRNSTEHVARIIPLIVERIKEKYQPDKIILFGSYAYGKPDASSDIDLLIVKETHEAFYKRWAEVCRIVSDLRHGIPFSPFVLTPKEWQSRLEISDPFIKEILEKGKMLYER